MSDSDKRWVVRDRRGREIYLTEERWKHIQEYHPELADHLDEVLDTIKTGRRKQDPFEPDKYRYYRSCDDLPPEFNHIVVVVVFRTRRRAGGITQANNFVTTAWPTYLHRGE